MVDIVSHWRRRERPCRCDAPRESGPEDARARARRAGGRLRDYVGDCAGIQGADAVALGGDRSRLVRGLGLERHGLQIANGDALGCVPSIDGPALTIWRDRARTQQELAARSILDSDRYPAFVASVARRERGAAKADRGPRAVDRRAHCRGSRGAAEHWPPVPWPRAGRMRTACFAGCRCLSPTLPTNGSNRRRCASRSRRAACSARISVRDRPEARRSSSSCPRAMTNRWLPGGRRAGGLAPSAKRRHQPPGRRASRSAPARAWSA